MTNRGDGEADGISVFTLGTTLLQSRWRIGRWMLAGAALAAAAAFLSPPSYVATTSFIPEGYDAGRTGLASLAGQLGVAVAGARESHSPDFYARLLTSRVLLAPIAHQTFVVPEKGGQQVSFLDLFEIQSGSSRAREEQAVSQLKKIVTPSIARSTGVVELAVTTKWPSVSLAIATALVNGVNEYNQRTRQGQAAAERKFVEGRLAIAGSDLRAAEDRLETFLKGNREFGGSQELIFERERLQRDVALKQQVFTSLTQSYEDVRIREVRDTPVITVIEPPFVPTIPEPRRRLTRVLFGALVGGLLGAFAAIISQALARRRSYGDPEVTQFLAMLAEVKGSMHRRIGRLKVRIKT